MVIRVQTRDNEPVEKALRRLRKLCNNEGVTKTSKAKSYFEKPSERRRREARERLKAIRLSMRAQRQDTAKLLNRRRKARKNARAAQRTDDDDILEQIGETSERSERTERRGPPGRDRPSGARPSGDKRPAAASRD